jgi:TPP-dependent pyruvate/acetoin dehydrogenase alpha subunit
MTGLSREQLINAYALMTRIREFEETIRRLHGEGKLPGFMHVSIGQEAVPVGVSLNLRPSDVITTTHRGHGDVIAKGAPLEGMFAEIYGRAGGLCRGKGGSMHVADVSRGVWGANGIVAAGMPIAVGAGLAFLRQQRDDVVVCYFGDGAIANGATHEALNMASLWRVPVVFVRVDNAYAESTPASEYQGMPDVVAYAASYGLHAEHVDGNDVERVADAAERAVARARAGEGPTFLQCQTYRKYGHNIGDPGTSRPSAEVEHWASRDPIDLARATLTGRHGLGDEDLAQILEAAVARNSEALEWAESQPPPPGEWAFEDVFATPAIVRQLERAVQ